MRRYPEEVHKFIKDNVRGSTTKELVELVNLKFGKLFTEEKMKSYKANHKLKSGTPGGIPAGRPTNVFPAEIKDFIEKNHIGVGPKDMTEILNITFSTNYAYSQLKAYYKNHGISSGLTGYFTKGQIPVNKGTKGVYNVGGNKTSFKKGHNPHNWKPVGSERIDVDGYTLIKTAEPNIWVPKHKIIWEEREGKVPEGHVLTFLDGNKNNIKFENLALITMAESLELTRSELRSENPEFTKTGILIVKVRKAARKIKHKEEK